MRRQSLLLILLAALALAGCVRKPGPRPVAAAPPTVVAESAPLPPPAAPAVAATAASAGTAAPPTAAMAALHPANVEPAEPTYALDSGDKLRVVVFGQEGLSNSYSVDAAGYITMPLIGAVPARERSPAGLSRAIADRLRNGYIREPHVAVEIEAYRPFFILGEVTAPGQYPYVANMTAETAVAIAGGFTPRASKSTVQVTRTGDGLTYRGKVPLDFQVRPGDTILVGERWF
jgi:polysaccharide export outer membrane protein